MIPLIILAAAVVAFLLFLVFQVWQRYFTTGEAAPAAQLAPVDLDAFENLTDPDEEQFLRVNLSSAEFRSVQRTRIHAAILYVEALSQNAGILVTVGQSARSDPNPETAASGQEILQRAIRLKMWCLLSLLRLNAALVFPAILPLSNTVANQYVLVTKIAARLPRKAIA